MTTSSPQSCLLPNSWSGSAGGAHESGCGGRKATGASFGEGKHLVSGIWGASQRFNGLTNGLFDACTPVDLESTEPKKVQVDPYLYEISTTAASDEDPFIESRFHSLEPTPMFDASSLTLDASRLQAPIGDPTAQRASDGQKDVLGEVETGYGSREKQKLENLIRLHMHRVGKATAPSAEQVPPPPGLLPTAIVAEMRERAAPGLSPPFDKPPTPPTPPEGARARPPKASTSTEFSYGSIGHPNGCAGPCKYLHMKSRGCQDGKACNRCHMCTWPRSELSCRQPAWPASGGVAPLAVPCGTETKTTAWHSEGKMSNASEGYTSEAEGPARSPKDKRIVTTAKPPVESVAKGKAVMVPRDPAQLSVGSANHPHACAGACKYYRKRRGCKDGAACDHCHICEWHSPPREGRLRCGGTALTEPKQRKAELP